MIKNTRKTKLLTHIDTINRLVYFWIRAISLVFLASLLSNCSIIGMSAGIGYHIAGEREFNPEIEKIKTLKNGENISIALKNEDIFECRFVRFDTMDITKYCEYYHKVVEENKLQHILPMLFDTLVVLDLNETVITGEFRGFNTTGMIIQDLDSKISWHVNPMDIIRCSNLKGDLFNFSEIDQFVKMGVIPLNEQLIVVKNDDWEQYITLNEIKGIRKLKRFPYFLLVVAAGLVCDYYILRTIVLYSGILPH